VQLGSVRGQHLTVLPEVAVEFLAPALVPRNQP
ncbi:MAG: hypothetical protein ACJAZO_005133, partial [Myxococcota bacterium]